MFRGAQKGANPTHIEEAHVQSASKKELIAYEKAPPNSSMPTGYGHYGVTKGPHPPIRQFYLIRSIYSRVIMPAPAPTKTPGAPKRSPVAAASATMAWSAETER